MKKRLGIIYFPDSTNIGDDVQTLAMLNLVQRVAPEVEVVPVDREQLTSSIISELDGVIISGWFMSQPSNWPPNNRNLLFISVHISEQYGAAQVLQSPKFADFYKRHEPIGCRDRGTMRNFQKLGVDAYYSGCATLTLNSDVSQNRDAPIILAIDPFLKVSQSESYNIWRLRQILSDDEMQRCELRQNTDFGLPQRSFEDRIAAARQYVDDIANASFILTSRIHAALPALGVHTRPYFLDVGYERFPQHRDRFDGIIELFPVIEDEHFKFVGRSRTSKVGRALRVDRLLDGGKKRVLAIDETKEAQALQRVQQIRESIEKEVSDFIERI